MADADDRVTYQFATDRETWRAWADSVPRSLNLDDRLVELIEQDTHAAEGEWEDMEQRSAELLARRIKHRAKTAEQALDEDSEKVADELAEIVRIARQFE